MRLRHPHVVRVFCALLLFVAFSAAAIWHFGSLRNGVLYLRGANCVVYPTSIILGEENRGQRREASVTVRNLTFSPLRVVGAATTCNCFLVESLPLVVPPGNIRKLRITVYLQPSAEEGEQMVTLFIDEGRLNSVPVRITWAQSV